MSPRQFSQQRGDNLRIRERLGEADHVPKRFLGVATAELSLQLSPQCGDNPLTVSGALCLEDLAPNTVADAPGGQGERCIDDLRRLAACIDDQLANLGEQYQLEDRRNGPFPGKPG